MQYKWDCRWFSEIGIYPPIVHWNKKDKIESQTSADYLSRFRNRVRLLDMKLYLKMRRVIKDLHFKLTGIPIFLFCLFMRSYFLQPHFELGHSDGTLRFKAPRGDEYTIFETWEFSKLKKSSQYKMFFSLVVTTILCSLWFRV